MQVYNNCDGITLIEAKYPAIDVHVCLMSEQISVERAALVFSADICLVFVSYLSRICLIFDSCVSCLSKQKAALVFSADICLAQPEELACVPKLGWPTSPRQLHYHLSSKCICLNYKIYLSQIAIYLFQSAKYICRKLKTRLAYFTETTALPLNLEMCLSELQNIIVSNCEIYLFQIAKHICRKLKTRLAYFTETTAPLLGELFSLSQLEICQPGWSLWGDRRHILGAAYKLLMKRQKGLETLKDDD